MIIMQTDFFRIVTIKCTITLARLASFHVDLAIIIVSGKGLMKRRNHESISARFDHWGAGVVDGDGF